MLSLFNFKSFSVMNSFLLSFAAFFAVIVLSISTVSAQQSYNQPNDYFVPDATGPGSNLRCGTNATPGNWSCALIDVGVNGTPVLPVGAYSVSASMWILHDDVGDLETVLVAPNGSVPANGNYNDALSIVNNRTSLFARVGAATTSTQCGDKSRADGTYKFGDAGGANGNFWTAAVNTGNAAAISATPLYAPVERNNNPASLISNFGGLGNYNGVWRVCMRDTNRVWDNQNGSNSGNKGGYFGKIVLTFSSSTAATSSIGGTVVDEEGNAIRNAAVTVFNTNTLERKTVNTNSFGYFTQNDMPSSDFYIVSVSHSRYRFETDTYSFTLNGDVSDIRFQGRNAPRSWNADSIEQFNQKVLSGTKSKINR